jgi:hypothetical protein
MVTLISIIKDFILLLPNVFNFFLKLLYKNGTQITQMVKINNDFSLQGKRIFNLLSKTGYILITLFEYRKILIHHINQRHQRSILKQA